jgi:hypothetical protein
MDSIIRWLFPFHLLTKTYPAPKTYCIRTGEGSVFIPHQHWMEVSVQAHAPAILLSGLASPLSINRCARCEEIHFSRCIQSNFTPLPSGSYLSMTVSDEPFQGHGQDNVVVIATSSGMDGAEFELRWKQDDLFYAYSTRQALDPHPPPVQCVPRFLPVGKWFVVWRWPHTHMAPSLRNCRFISLLPFSAFLNDILRGNLQLHLTHIYVNNHISLYLKVYWSL